MADPKRSPINPSQTPDSLRGKKGPMPSRPSTTSSGPSQSESSRGATRLATAVQSRPEPASCNDWQARVAQRAYELYVQRGCCDGHDLDDWLEAERQVRREMKG
ncbi:MAG: DUF2934 domain-containing protein [Planctomycetota bacterium]